MKAGSSWNGHRESTCIHVTGCTDNCRWYRYLINRRQYLWNVPGHVSKECRETIEKHNKANNGCRKQHVCVISEPRKVDGNFVTVVLPVDKENTPDALIFRRVLTMYSQSYQQWCDSAWRTKINNNNHLMWSSGCSLYQHFGDAQTSYNSYTSQWHTPQWNIDT